MQCQFPAPIQQGQKWLYACSVCNQPPVSLPFEQDPAMMRRSCQTVQARRDAPVPKRITKEEIAESLKQPWQLDVEAALAEPGDPPRNALEVLACIETCEKCPGGNWDRILPCKILCEFKLRAAWQYGHCPEGHW